MDNAVDEDMFEDHVSNLGREAEKRRVDCVELGARRSAGGLAKVYMKTYILS